MFLKRLELQGFKSFADKTRLEFGNGVTSVVGPNGSGKSNISDAIRWVMGEMSAKQLRGSNMQDVIFAGTEIRKPLNYAEVSLVLDNSDRIFNLEYDEVIVTRRVFRSGETSYMINKSNCRLKDIHELFMDTGLGRDGYSIIGQGNVSQILSTKAEDRRNIFEEAAGVSKYKYKKDEAERKLLQVEDNLLRIGDITSELEGQLGPLKNQSEKARKYLVIYDEYKKLDVNTAMYSLKKNEVSEKDIEEKVAQVEAEIEDVKKLEGDTEKRITKLYEEGRQKDDELKDKNEQLINNRSKIMECKNDISLSDNSINNNRQRLERLKNEISENTQKRATYKSEISATQLEIEDKKNYLSKLNKNAENLKNEEEKLNAEKTDLEKKLSLHKSNIIEILSKISSEKAKKDGIETLRESFLSRKSEIEESIKSSLEDRESYKKECDELTVKKAEISEKHGKITALIETQNSNLTEKRNALTTLSEEQNAKQIELRAKISKLHILVDLENEYDGYAKSVKLIMRSDEMKHLSLYGTVAGLVETKSEYAVAIETALGGASQNIVVESESDAKEAIAFLRRTNSGRATFLPISSVKGRTLDNVKEISKCDGFIGVGCDLITFNSKYQSIMQSLLGRVVIVDNIDNAISISRKFSYKFKVVTLKGDVLNAGGSISGGSTGRTGGFLSRSAEIKKLKTERAELENYLKKSLSEIEEIKQEIDGMNTRLDSYLPMQRDYENEIIKITERLKNLSDFLDGGENAQSGFESELERISAKLSETADQIALSLSQIRRLEGEEKAENEESEKLAEALDDVTEKLDDCLKAIVEARLDITNAERDITELENSIETITNSISESEADETVKKSDIEEINRSNEVLEYTKSEKLKTIETLENIDAQIKKQIEVISSQKDAVTKQQQEIQNSNKDLTDRHINLQQELSRVSSKLEKLRMEKEGIINRLWDEYELTYSSADELYSEPANIKEDTEHLKELKGKLKALGNVNMDSIDEYKKVLERFEFLSAQKKDLDESKINLEKIIVSMVELMEKHFKEQFNAITESFSYVFKEMFGGGKGKLYLQDPDNVLESGIEIEVQLPGKGLQNINLYSGGEKSFIAIALLFSILRVKPTPFCILDEIDAALDDVNVSRFATYLKNYIEQSQFIVITHRRGTMEASNIMYGVTMQEKGVSKLLSLDMDSVEDDMVE